MGEPQQFRRTAARPEHAEGALRRFGNTTSELPACISGKRRPWGMAGKRYSLMSVHKDAAFTLPRGAAGMFLPRDGPPPETDQRMFRAALFAAARAARGRVGETEERAYPRTFHMSSVIVGTAECVVLCHAHHPWIACAQERRDWYTEQFLSPPPWARSFADQGFTVLDRAQLTLPFSAIDTSVLTPGEWREVRSYGITTLGGLLFNSWD